MKDFLKITLAVIFAMIIVTILSFAVLAGAAGSMSMSGKSYSAIPSEGVLKIDMSSMVVAEQPEESNPIAMVRSGETFDVLGLWDCVCAINKAAEDPAVQYIYLKTDGNMTSLANLSEIRKSLEKFRQSGKAVVAYLESPSTGSYYLASVADKVYMTSHPGGATMMTGLSSQMMFLKDLLDKIGVNVQLIRHGKYKSAGEMFIRNSASEANREQYQAMINSMWGSISGEMARSRGISEEALNAMVDNLALNLPEDFVKCGLVDSLLTREQLKDQLATLSVKESFSDVNIIEFRDYVAQRVTNVLTKAKNKIAVIYADGEIVDGDDLEEVAGDRFAAVISKVRADSSVKAVVLRVNSPGGSVIASDKIKTELDLLKSVKPLVASYGGYAASGGYWISSGCDKIFTDEVTLTGSIGVFSMIPDFSKVYKDVAHIGITTINSNKHSDMYSLTRPLDTDELAYMQASVEDIYDRFTGLVAVNRGMTQDRVDEIAQGRVWTGADALGINLADEIGTLEDAIHYAAVAAGDPDLASWKIAGYPEPLTTMQMLMEMFGETNKEENILAGSAFGSPARVFLDWKKDLEGKSGSRDFCFARLPFEMQFK